ncbi:MAG: lytic transglycosylase domain-containing protein [Flavobacteriales bacterium]|nr:lytic transglycosylase domain-containing protein [Flavobacteriales bacterium]
MPSGRSLSRLVVAVFTLAVGALILNLFVFSASTKGTDLDHQRSFNDNYKIFALTLPNSVSFCGEKVPLELIDVRERLDRELLVNTYWQSNSIMLHKRAARWLPIISEVLREEGVPDDLKYLAMIESGLTQVVSPAGATGFWQFMAPTAKQYGLRVDAEVDERYDVIKSTRAACRYLKGSHAKYGSWAMAAASYNLGIGGLDKQIARQQETNYFDLLLPEETSRYVFRALAAKEIVSDPPRYGFHIREQDLYAPYRTRALELQAPVLDLAAFAKEQRTDYKTLKLLNPWLRETRLSDLQGKEYTLLLPAEGFNGPTISRE